MEETFRIARETVNEILTTINNESVNQVTDGEYEISRSLQLFQASINSF